MFAVRIRKKKSHSHYNILYAPEVYRLCIIIIITINNMTNFRNDEKKHLRDEIRMTYVSYPLFRYI